MDGKERENGDRILGRASMIKTNCTKLSQNNNLFLKQHMKLGGQSDSGNSREIRKERIVGTFDQSIVVCVGNFHTTTSQEKNRDRETRRQFFLI